MKKLIKTLYHGSPVKINDGIIRIKPGHINGMKTEITAAFATSDFAHACLYATMRSIGDGWKSPRGSDKLFVQKIQPSISGVAYIYELDFDGFEQDGDSDYYSLQDKEIKRTIEIDILQEIINGNIKVYVLQDEVDFSNLSRQESLDLWDRTLRENKFKLYKPVT